MKKKRHYVGMRRFIIFCLSAIVAVSFFISQNREEESSLPGRLEQMMNCANMSAYCDPFYGYLVHYPSFFVQVPDSLLHEKGCCQFRFGNLLKIVQTAYVRANLDGLTLQQGMEHFAMEHHASERKCGADYFILSGPLYVGNGKNTRHRFYAKYVQRQKLWFVQCLTYPENCAQAVEPLIRQIEDWQVWEERKE